MKSSVVDDLRTDHGIFIDTFTRHALSSTECPTFILTHMHSDHMTVSQSFSEPIYTLVPLAILGPLYPTVQFVHCVENQTYYTPSTSFRLFRTHHTAYSCGVLFPEQRVVYLGDSRMCDVLLRQTERFIGTSSEHWTIVYDPIFEHFPFLETTSPCSLLTYALRTYHPVLKCVHHGILFFLSLCSSLKFRADPTLPPVTRTIMEDLGLLDPASTYTLVGRKYSDTHVVASALWHVIYGMNPGCIYETKTGSASCYHVFLSCHAIPAEIRTWRKRFPTYAFEPLVIDNETNMKKSPRCVNEIKLMCMENTNKEVA